MQASRQIPRGVGTWLGSLLNASGPCVLSKMVVPGGRTGQVMLTNGLEINRLVKPLPCCLLFFRTLGRWQKRAGVENKEKA